VASSRGDPNGTIADRSAVDQSFSRVRTGGSWPIVEFIGAFSADDSLWSGDINGVFASPNSNEIAGTFISAASFSRTVHYEGECAAR
jgi:hypothetical protein